MEHRLLSWLGNHDGVCGRKRRYQMWYIHESELYALVVAV